MHFLSVQLLFRKREKEREPNETEVMRHIMTHLGVDREEVGRLVLQIDDPRVERDLLLQQRDPRTLRVRSGAAVPEPARRGGRRGQRRRRSEQREPRTQASASHRSARTSDTHHDAVEQWWRLASWWKLLAL